MQAWALDLDGVIWRGTETVPGAPEAVARLRQAGAPVVFVTNSSSRTPAQVAAKLAGHGIPDAGELVVTSAMAAATLVGAGERVFVIGGDGIRTAVEERGAEAVVSADDDGPIDTVVVGITDRFDYALLSRAMAAIGDGARFLATNDDATFPTSAGRFLPGNGALVAAVATASGVAPVVAGKPNRTIAEVVRARLGDRPGIMVGDRPDTDGLFATVLGYRFGLVLTGVVGPGDLPVEPEPDVVAADLAQLVAAALG